MRDDQPSGGESNPSLNCSMLFHGFTSEEQAREFGDPLYECLVEISRHLDLERLDAITITFFYAESLKNLDRGYENAIAFTADENEVALPVMVKRDGVSKMHLVIDARILPPLRDPKHKDYAYILHLVANQCVLVQDTQVQGPCVPRCHGNPTLRDGRRIFPRQDDLAVLGRLFGESAERALSHRRNCRRRRRTFSRAVGNRTIKQIEALHKQYRADRDAQTFTTQAVARSDGLMHAACRLLGNLHGTATPVQERSNAYKVLEGHWFEPIFRDLDKALIDLSANYGRWQRADFNVLADIARHLLAVWRIEVAPHQDGGLAFFIDR